MTSIVRGNDGFDSAQYVNLLNTYAGRNKIINGCFRIWQRGSTQTATGYGSDDRWTNNNNGTTKTHSRQTFTLGQTDVPGNPKFFSRTVVSSVAGAANYCQKNQNIEGVGTLAGEIVTLSFWAKADSPKNISVDLVQYFGSGGSPSATVEPIGQLTIPLTSSWTKITHTFAVPSITGKTLGTDGNDYLRLRIWFDAGSNYNDRSGSLGQQSGTFDIANVQLERGTEATPFEERPTGYELFLCERYYQVGGVSEWFMATWNSGSQILRQTVRYRTVMRKGGTPILAVVVGTTPTIVETSYYGFCVGFSGTDLAVNNYTWTVDAEL